MDDDTVKEDVLKLAQYFEKKYHTLEKAVEQFDHASQWDIHSFIKTWGMHVSEPYELFAHIDADCSSIITLDELFAVLQEPLTDIAEREKRRQQADVTRIYEELAANIRQQFGGNVRKCFEAMGAGEKEIKEPGFRRLLTLMHMELTKPQVDRLFAKIDIDKSGSIAVQELQQALGFYLVRGDLVDLATFLAERDGSVTAAFEKTFEKPVTRTSATGRSPSGSSLPAFLGAGGSSLPPTPSGASPMSAATAAAVAAAGLPPPLAKKLMDDREFLNVLAKLKVLGDGDKSFMTHDHAVFLFDMMREYRPVTSIDDLRQRLHDVFREVEQAKEDLKEQKERAERLKKQRAYCEFNGGIKPRRRDYSDAWKGEVEAWTADASKVAKAGGQARPEGVTAQWDIEARSGSSAAQLQDYLAALERKIQQSEAGPGGLQELQREVAGRWECLHGWDDSQSPITPDTPMSQSFGLSGGRGRGSPAVGEKYLEQTSRQQEGALKSKQLIQAAAVGDGTKLQTVLKQKADVNTVGWGGVTPLMTAAHHGREISLHLLLAARADLGRTDTYGRTAVDHAQSGKGNHKASVVQCLRGHGGVSGKELKAQVDALAKRVFEIETECSRLNEFKGKLPSRSELDDYKKILRRTATREGLARSVSRGPADPSPRNSPRPGAEGEYDTPSFSIGAFKGGERGAVSQSRPPMQPVSSRW